MKYLCQNIDKLNDICKQVYTMIQDSIISAVKEYNGGNPIRLAVDLAYYVNMMRDIEGIMEYITARGYDGYIFINENSYAALTYYNDQKIRNLFIKIGDI